MSWLEQNGRGVNSSIESYGFARALIENQLTAELGATGSFLLRPEGAEAHLDIAATTGLIAFPASTEGLAENGGLRLDSSRPALS